MRDVIVAANWKMHTTPADAGELARTIAARTRETGVIRVICPPFVCLAAVRDALAVADPSVAVGAQNVHHELAGAYTGEISAPMLAGLATGSSSATPSDAATPARRTSRSAASSAARSRPASGRSCASVSSWRTARPDARPTSSTGSSRAPWPATSPTRWRPAGWSSPTSRSGPSAPAGTRSGRTPPPWPTAIRASLRSLGWGAPAADVPVLYGGQRHVREHRGVLRRARDRRRARRRRLAQARRDGRDRGPGRD